MQKLIIQIKHKHIREQQHLFESFLISLFLGSDDKVLSYQSLD